MRSIFSLLVVVLSLGLSRAATPPELPSTPAGKVLAGYLDALNSGNKDKLETFIKARGGMTQGWTGSFDKLEAYLSKH